MTQALIQGKYQILSLLGRGGMGSVYHVMHEGLKRQDALKKLHEQYAEDPEFVERFMREARAMARLDHPHIIRIYDVFADGDANYIAMEYFAGGSLVKQLEEREHIDQDAVIFIVKQLASALAYAHTQGVVHRDIKPDNVLVTSDNTVKITDFGIAAVADELTLTSTGQMVGSPRYMSPEQAKGSATDQRSDLFSLGIVFYEMLTGEMVFEGDSSIAIIGKLA
ncbi:MAG: serine/threonine protein kinase [Gammaproteobacteria bacterium]|nr:serine/threonine protein kinase [Gammaproteobacteria bacterium]